MIDTTIDAILVENERLKLENEQLRKDVQNFAEAAYRAQDTNSKLRRMVRAYKAFITSLALIRIEAQQRDVLNQQAEELL